jgi:hypothetical protein
MQLFSYIFPDFKKPLGPKGKAPWITDDGGNINWALKQINLGE